jgi:hypothetical protein
MWYYPAQVAIDIVASRKNRCKKLWNAGSVVR